MEERNSLLSTREAAEISGYSSRHIQNMIKKGKLSATRDDGGNYLIEKSEFYRVFPDAHNKRSDANNSDKSSRIVLEKEVQHLKEMLAEKSKQNEFLHKRLEMATTEKLMLMETLNNNQKFLINQNKRKKILGIF